MKKILSIFILLLTGLVLVACEEDDVLTHQMVFDTVSITYQEGDSSLSVTQNITLPSVTDFEGVTIEWLSSNANVISVTGVVNRPVGTNAQVTLTLQVTINDVTDERNFSLTVIATEAQQNTFYTVTFDSTGGSVVANLQVLAGGLITKPTDPTRTNFEFEGWYKNQALTLPWNFATDTVTANTTLYAYWVSPDNPTYTVTFNVNGGSIVTSQTIDEDGLVSQPNAPTRSGFVFDGWYKDAEFDVAWNFATDTITANTIIYARWIAEAQAFTVSFNVNGGTAIGNIIVEENNLVTAPDEPTRADYLFNGWFKDAAFAEAWDFETDTVTAATTLYAAWVPEGTEPGTTIYTVTFIATPSAPMPLGFAAEDGLIIKPTDPELFGFSFEGWFTDDETFANEWNFATDLVTENITLYALWEELPPALPTPTGALGSPISTFFVAIGAYATTEGYGGSLALRFTNNATNQIYIHTFAHPAGATVAFSIADWVAANLPAATYSVTYKAVANGTTHSDSDWWPGSMPMTVSPSPLAQPVAQINDGVLTWNEVINATSYNVIVGDETYTDVTSPFNLNELDLLPGIHAVIVVAKAPEGFADSQRELELLVPDPEAEPLDAPVISGVVNDVITWSAVENAVSYTVFMDGQSATTSSTSYDLQQFFKAGTFDVTVRANGDGAFHLNSPESEPLEVVLVAALIPLESLTADHLAGPGGGLVNTHGDGFRNIVWHGGGTATIMTQGGMANGIRIRVYASNGTTLLGETTLVPSQSGSNWNTNGGGFGGHLKPGNIVHLQVRPSTAGITANYTYSLPLILTLAA